MPTHRSLRRRSVTSVVIASVVVVGVGVAFVAQLMSGQAAVGPSPKASDTGSSEPTSTVGPPPQTVLPAPELKPIEGSPTAGPDVPGSSVPPPASDLADLAEELANKAVAIRVASFNMLGASHTRKHGGRKGFAQGKERAAQAATVVQRLDLDVIGAQEFEPQQQRVFRARLPRYDAFPGTAPKSYVETTNTILWDSKKFRLVDAQMVAIPYFGGSAVRMPYILLEQIATGRRVWFANFHNAADVHGPAQQWREQATDIQADLANRLSADGTPVILTGDFNERASYFCRLTAKAPGIKSASGATAGPPCSVPDHPLIDWVLGSASVTFQGYQVVDGGLVDQASDHPVVLAEALLSGGR